MLNYLFKIIYISVALICAAQQPALAIQWQALNGSTRFKASYDMDSIRLTSLGRLEVWLRFVPRGEDERKSAAIEYGKKGYRSHMEYYEIDCSEKSSQLKLIDIFGVSRSRLKRIQGGSETTFILPGSVLDNVAGQICPTLEDETPEINETDATDNPEAVSKQIISSEKSAQINKLLLKTTTKDATAETWKELGNAYFDTDQPELAIKAYQQALATTPNDTDILNDQGAMYRQTGNFRQAVENFEKAFSIDTKNLESLYNSGYVYAFDIGDTSKAMVLWHKYLEFESTGETAERIKNFIKKFE